MGELFKDRDTMITNVLLKGLTEEKAVMQLRPLIAIKLTFEQI